MKSKIVLGMLMIILPGILLNCTGSSDKEQVTIVVEAESFSQSSRPVETGENGSGRFVGGLKDGDWLAYEVQVPVAGRYRTEVTVANSSEQPASVWVEDYVDNKDGRTYNITGAMPVSGQDEFVTTSKDGSPLNVGTHKMKVHVNGDGVKIDRIAFYLLKEHQVTPKSLKQNMDGTEWHLVWADEFEGEGLPDTSKWTFDLGNWGWGNNEPQYYTEFRTENARQEGGNLIIEARPNDMGQEWTSARLTTRGKVSFVYGKIEFRAKPPAGVGTWAAGWLLGDEYRDEISWPYCGEIDVLECVGREVDQETGDGINHASCHTRAYYFKQGNHLTSTLPVKGMTTEFHTYGIIWTPTEIRAYVDDTEYYVYDKTNGEWEWPFNKPQNIIINLAMGGGMGGAIDPDLTRQQLIVDYIRVYELR